LSIFEKDRHIFVDLLTGKSTCNIKNEDGVIETVEYASENVDSVMDELSEFICSIKGEKTPCVRGEDGLKALALANRIKEHIA
jgi:predicted dehydrogenase